MRMKKNKQMADLEKSEIFKITNSQHFFTKISGIGSWVDWIN